MSKQAMETGFTRASEFGTTSAQEAARADEPRIARSSRNTVGSASSAQSAAVPKGAASSLPVMAALDAISPKLLEALTKHLGSAASVHAALQSGDLQALNGCPGLSPRKALDLVRQAKGLDAAVGQFLGTASARGLFDDVLDRIASHAATSHGRDRLHLLAPLGKQADAERSAAKVLQHAERVAKLDRDRVRALLRKVHPVRKAAPRLDGERLLVGRDEDLERMRELGASQWLQLASLREGAQADPDLLVITLGELKGVEAGVSVPEDAGLHEVAPESVLSAAAANRGLLEALAELATLLGTRSVAPEILKALQEAPPPRLPPGALRKATAQLHAELEAVLQHKVASLQLSGADLLAALGKRMPAPVQTALQETLNEGRRRLEERTGHAVQPFLPTIPITVDDAEVDRLEDSMQERGRLAEFHAKAQLAKRIHPLWQKVPAEVQAMQEFDVEFALGCFALEQRLTAPRFGPALGFTDSLHLDLATVPNAQRIAYHIGRDAPVALLTGANSGGKTTLLEHLAQVAILARIGLPVPGADVEVPWLEELHYVTARKGLDAGAFEAFLRAFLPLAQPGPKRLVLADEVESVTELEAAGRIIAFFLDRMAQSGSLAVVVSHLAPQVLQHCRDARLRVDGIEATGLDAQHRLVVDRAPRMGLLARSTPELIVQRLAATAKGADKALYGELLEALQAPVEAPVRSQGTRRAP